MLLTSHNHEVLIPDITKGVLFILNYENNWVVCYTQTSPKDQYYIIDRFEEKDEAIKLLMKICAAIASNQKSLIL
mgnify:CR=1 FL=1